MLAVAVAVEVGRFALLFGLAMMDSGHEAEALCFLVDMVALCFLAALTAQLASSIAGREQWRDLLAAVGTLVHAAGRHERRREGEAD